MRDEIFNILQTRFIEWLEEKEKVDAKEIACAFGILVGRFFSSMPVEIRSHVIKDFTDQLEKTYRDE